MNEPAIFYTPEGMAEKQKITKELLSGDSKYPPVAIFYLMSGNDISSDYARMYHKIDGKLVCHNKVHNLFGYNMTRAASEAFAKLVPDRRILLFSRSSYIGMHRYGGIWTGDNKSWWSHILLCLKMLPGLNMCGFLYVGCDLGGFRRKYHKRSAPAFLSAWRLHTAHAQPFCNQNARTGILSV